MIFPFSKRKLPVTGEYVVRTNKGIDQLLSGENIVSFVKSSRLRWLGNVVRINGEILPKMIKNARMKEGRIARGRRRKRWMDDVLQNRSIAILGMKRPNWRNVKEDGILETVVLQQDEAHPHFVPIVWEYLDAIFPCRWIDRDSNRIWKPRYPDVTPVDFFA
ncbi:hypothetical protein C0J52_13615 [Blattella germanica]|nr:hypothetical protein C0J52_13615 [Blattella germanica]